MIHDLEADMINAKQAETDRIARHATKRQVDLGFLIAKIAAAVVLVLALTWVVSVW